MESRSLQIVEQGTGVITNAAEWNKARIDFVRNTFCGGAPEAEASAFIEICKRRGLAPEERQVYLTKRGDGWVIQTGIDGYRLIADRTGQYAGSDEPLFIGATPEGYPEQASVTVYKMVGGQPRPFTSRTSCGRRCRARCWPSALRHWPCARHSRLTSRPSTPPRKWIRPDRKPPSLNVQRQLRNQPSRSHLRSLILMMSSTPSKSALRWRHRTDQSTVLLSMRLVINTAGGRFW
jgi:hypothetical protein